MKPNRSWKKNEISESWLFYVLPYCELCFCHRDYCRVSNYQILSKGFKSGLRFKTNVPCGLSNHGFVQLSQYWEDIKNVKKKKPGQYSWRQIRASKYQISKHFSFFKSTVVWLHFHRSSTVCICSVQPSNMVSMYLLYKYLDLTV